MRKNSKKHRSIAGTALAMTGGFVGGLSVACGVWAADKIHKKRLVRDDAELGDDNHQALKDDLPILLAEFGAFTDEEIAHYRDLLDQVRDMFGYTPLVHLHIALNLNCLGCRVDMTEEKIRNYFNAWQTLCDCDMEGKWLSAECSSEQNSVERN